MDGLVLCEAVPSEGDESKTGKHECKRRYQADKGVRSRGGEHRC